MQLEGSIFLEFLFKRLAKSRKTLYTAGLSDEQAINSVISESVRTIRTLFTEGEKSNAELREVICESFIFNLMHIDSVSEQEVDTLMSLI